MNIRVVANSLYGVVGTVFLIVGATVLLLTTGLLPAVLGGFIMKFGHDDPTTLHIIQELGSVLIFVGLITFWFIKHYEQSLAFHWAMTTFWMFFALAHWFDVRGSFHAGSGQLVNTIPFILFVLVGVLRKRLDARAGEAG
jgi:hypothetical protein